MRYAFGVVRHVLVIALASLPFVPFGAGCGNVNSSSGGVNAPCTRDYDCASGLTCQSGVCTGPAQDAGVPSEAGPKDAGGDG